MPRFYRSIVPSLTNEHLQALFAAPDRRSWMGIRDRAILLVLLDTLMRISELVASPPRTWTLRSP
jgi:integrase/recombinase XerD